FESSRLDKGTYTLFRCAMTTLSHNLVKVIHPPGCAVNPVSRRRRVKQRKQELLALWTIFRLGRLRRQQGMEATACKAARIACDCLTRHLKTPSNDGCGDPLQAAQNGQCFLAIPRSAAFNQPHEIGRQATRKLPLNHPQRGVTMQ